MKNILKITFSKHTYPYECPTDAVVVPVVGNHITTGVAHQLKAQYPLLYKKCANDKVSTIIKESCDAGAHYAFKIHVDMFETCTALLAALINKFRISSIDIPITQCFSYEVHMSNQVVETLVSETEKIFTKETYKFLKTCYWS